MLTERLTSVFVARVDVCVPTTVPAVSLTVVLSSVGADV